MAEETEFAFPHDEYAWNNEHSYEKLSHIHTQHRGITVRDYFAAKVLQGLCSNSTIKIGEDEINFGDEHHLQALASTSYLLADAMLKERDNGSTDQG